VNPTPAEWYEPGVEEVSDGIYRIPLPLPGDGLRAVNVYALRGGGELAMIDGGWAFADSQEHLGRALGQIGFGLADIRRILVTHIHRDHYTLAIALREQFGCHVSLGVGEQPNLDELTEVLTKGRPFRHNAVLVRAGVSDLAIPQESEAQSHPRYWQQPDEWLDPGSSRTAGGRHLAVVATPGHTSGHVVFHDEAARMLFAGDHVLPTITPSIGFESAPARWPLRDYLDSLRRVSAMPDARLLPAHGMVTDSVHARVAALLLHHEERLQATLDAVKAGASTAREVAEILRWTRHHRAMSELNLSNQRLAISETLAHLDVLVLQGRAVAATDETGADHFTVA